MAQWNSAAMWTKILLFCCCCLIKCSIQQEVRCPQYCGCISNAPGPPMFGSKDMDLFKVKCIGLHHLPENIPPQVNYLDIDCLERTTIKQLDPESFESFNETGNLYHLSVLQCNVQTIKEDFFQPAFFSNLTTVNLTNNLIETIENTTFSLLKELLVLDLSYNEISYLEKDVFGELYLLELLFLNGNQIPDIEIEAFSGLTQLKELHLKGNKISHLENGLFSDLVNLEILDLTNNMLTSIHNETFEGLHSIFSLHLSGNLIREVDFLNLQNLLNLDLTNNRISFLSEDHFVNMTGLLTLFLGKNSMYSINVNAFNGLPSLKHLRLDHNHLSYVTTGLFDTLSSLEILELQYNQISVIPNGTFDHLPSLKILNISSNKLINIDENSFGQLSSLAKLDLCCNQLTVLSNGAFATINSSSISLIDISQNRIKKIGQEFLPSNREINTLDLSRNPTLEGFDPLSFLNATIKQLNISGCSMKTLQKEIFSTWAPTLSLLDISNNKDELYLPRDFFKDSNLVQLFLGNTQLSNYGAITESLRPQVFVLDGNDLALLDALDRLAFMTSLTKLSLRRTLLHEINAQPFSNLSSLVTLDLSENDLVFTDVDNNTLPDGLKELILEKNMNPLTLPGTFLQGIILSELHLSGSKLTDIDFLQNAVIENLFLDNCQLGDLVSSTSHFQQAALQSVSLAYNGLHAVPQDLLNTMPNLLGLYISHNNITDLTQADFKVLSKLRHIDLSYNKITKLQEGLWNTNPFLLHVNLSHNNIFTVGSDLFPGITQSINLFDRILDVSSNELNTLEKDVWESLLYDTDTSVVRYSIFLQNNDIYCNCEVKWFAEQVLHLYTMDQEGSIPTGGCSGPMSRSFLQLLPDDVMCRAPKILGMWRFSIGNHAQGVVCEASGDPTPSIIWFDHLGRQLLRSSPSFEKNKLNNHAYLTLYPKDSPDITLVCAAENIHGKSTLEVNDILSLPLYTSSFLTTSPSTPFASDTDWKLTIILTVVATFIFTAVLIMCVTHLCRNSACCKGNKDSVSYTLRKRGGYQVQRANDVIRSPQRQDYDTAEFAGSNAQGEDNYYHGVGTSGSWVFEATPSKNRETSTDSRGRKPYPSIGGSRSRRSRANQDQGVYSIEDTGTELPELVPYALKTLDVPKHYSSQRLDMGGEPHYDLYDNSEEQTGSRVNLIPMDDSSDYHEHMSSPVVQVIQPVGEIDIAPDEPMVQAESQQNEMVVQPEVVQEARCTDTENINEPEPNVSLVEQNCNLEDEPNDSGDVSNSDNQTVEGKTCDQGDGTSLSSISISITDNQHYESTDISSEFDCDTQIRKDKPKDTRGVSNMAFKPDRDIVNEDDAQNNADTVKEPRYTSLVELSGGEPVISHTKSFPNIAIK